ncbi:hypothetical protein Y032_0088g2135 [Ancylostoma ceylanicum]|uniref:Uncharacterized protein n=1 Tax=Ancylostoma ceylanicum TaxID=53326 RepID=A0A016TNH1_9BILA|nr:hypothetical protein Y032_0088g2135 [Ancylostoma ceylanicum]
MENLEVGVEAVLRLVSIHDLEEAYFTIAFLSVLGAPHHLAIHVMRGSTTVDLIPVNANQPVQVQKGEQRNIEMDLNRIEFASCHDRRARRAAREVRISIGLFVITIHIQLKDANSLCQWFQKMTQNLF